MIAEKCCLFSLYKVLSTDLRMKIYSYNNKKICFFCTLKIGNWTKDSIFGHKKDDVKQQNSAFNMQKSKSSTNVGQVFSKKIWKSRSKSQTRPDSPAQPHWTPQVNNSSFFLLCLSRFKF